jgi:hypothetical protein
MLELVDKKCVKGKGRKTKEDTIKKRNEKVDNDIIDNLGSDLQTMIKQANYRELKIVEKELKLMEEKYGNRWMNMKWDLTI